MTTYAILGMADRTPRLASSSSGAPPEVTLVSRYALDGGSAADSEAAPVNGTIVSTFTSTASNSLVTGVAGTSFFKASTSGGYITLPASQAKHDLGELSITIYYQPTASTGKHTLIAAHTPGVNAAGDFSIERLTNGRLRGWHVGQDVGLRFFEGTDGIAATNLVNGTAYRITLALGPSGARLYLNDTLVATILENTNGWNNSIQKYIGIWTDGIASPLEGVIDYISIWSGQLQLSGVAALPSATSIVVAIDDAAGALAASTTTDVDVAANDVLAGSLALNFEILTDPAGRLSVVNNNTVDAQIRITTPAAPAVDTNESGTYRVSEAGGAFSNAANLTWTRTGGSATFPFVTTWAPTADHTGMTTKPTFTSSAPASTAVTDPMSGLQLIRLGGEPGATVFRYDGNGAAVNTGLVFPNALRNPNTPTAFKSINSDGTLILIAEFFNVGTQPGGTLCRAYIIDVTGQYSGGVPWRIIRASSLSYFGEAASGFHFWDPTNPFRLFVKANDGRVDAWYPIGTAGQNPAGPGTVSTWIAAPSEYDSFVGPANGRDHDNVTSRSGRWHMAGCRRTSDGAWGGIRIDLTNQVYTEPFVASPLALQTTNRPTLRQMAAGSSGQYCIVQTPNSGGAAQTGVDITGETILDSTPSGFSHPTMVEVDGVDHVMGVQGTAVYVATWPLPSGPVRTVAAVPQANPTNLTPLLGDRIETYGATGGGSTTGDRYVIHTRNTGGGGGQRSIVGVRIATNDSDVVRFICDPRNNRASNASECHAQAWFGGSQGFVLFPSNWNFQAAYSDSSISPYVAILPAGWASPNNDGS